MYALVAPFPTVADGVTSDELHQAWKGSPSGPFAGRPLWMADSTLAAFTELWGAPASGAVQTAPADQILNDAWKNLPSWGIVPFEALDPKWKVLTVDGQSPIRKDFNPAGYPLQVFFTLQSQGLLPSGITMPMTNRDPSKLTTVILTGTTSLVREIAYQMEVKGIDYPATDIGDLLRQADILHVSNKTSFDPNCPPPNPDENRFYCSDPRYLGLLLDVGVKVVELTGPHILDNGTGSFLYTLNLYKQNNIQYYGGGANLAEARRPLLIENHGNKIAFIGCNAGEPPQPVATVNSPGANPCDYIQLTAQIHQLRSQGYLPIVTFQYKEGYSPQVMPWQSNDFQKAAEAGAVIVSGSQAHAPLEMEFYKDTFIHYGLGNLFFGQMGNQPPNPGMTPQIAQRYEFIDRHVFYDGRYINTELLTAMLEDYARPRPMTPEERAAFLTAYFGYSGWIPLIPTPAPEQTPTLYPLLIFKPLPTATAAPSRTPLPKATPTP
jgi:Bacterial capsule synthesis protein PGA_cap